MPLTIEGGQPQVFDYSSAIAHQNSARMEAQARMFETQQRADTEAQRMAFEQQRWQDEPGREAARQNRAAALEMQAYEGKVTIQEQMENQRKQNQIGAIRSAIDSGYLTAEEGNNEMFRLQSGVDRTQLRQQRDQYQQQQQLRQQQLEHGRTANALLQAHLATLNQTAEQRTREVFDEPTLNRERDNLISQMDSSQYDAYQMLGHVAQDVEQQAQRNTRAQGGSRRYMLQTDGNYHPLNDHHSEEQQRRTDRAWAYAHSVLPTPIGMSDDLSSSNATHRERGQATMRRHQEALQAAVASFLGGRSGRNQGGLPPSLQQYGQNQNGGGSSGGQYSQSPPGQMGPFQPAPATLSGRAGSATSRAWGRFVNEFNPAAPQHQGNWYGNVMDRPLGAPGTVVGDFMSGMFGAQPQQGQ